MAAVDFFESIGTASLIFFAVDLIAREIFPTGLPAFLAAGFGVVSDFLGFGMISD
ncbi:MAG: hypothetical protein WA771_11500 [Chthoniobacterales bacterium]